MSRSYRKNLITGIAVAKRSSMRSYRKERSGKERAKQRNLLANAQRGDENAASTLMHEQEPWNEWDCPRDGKRRWDLEDWEKPWKLRRK